MDYRFYINDLEIQEPIGWDDFELSMKRDDTYHGMQFEVSTGALRFFGVGGAYLKEQKETYKIQASATFTAQSTCAEEYETIITGRLNFGKYKDICGSNGCIVSIPFEEEGCKVTFKNRFDQKVDLDNRFALDNMTVLPDYAQLGQAIQIPAKALQAAVDGSVSEDGYTVSATVIALLSGIILMVRPDYEIERYNNIETGQLIGFNNCDAFGDSNDCPGPITPQLLFEDIVECFDGNFTYTSRYKGSFTKSSGAGLIWVKHKIIKWDGVGVLKTDGDIVQEEMLYNGLPSPPGGVFAFDFDNTITGTTTIPDGIGFYAVIEVFTTSDSGGTDITVNFDTETSINIEAIKLCPATDSQYYLVHEALSRVAESITNTCIRVKSEYYGRIDSQPFAFDEDGCGSKRMLTSGLKLRNAPDGKFFASAKDLIAGLNAIDNIGFDIIEDTTIPNRFLLRIEPVSEFYQDFEMLRLDSVALASNEIQEAMHYALIKVGYEKWEVERINGLNEFNSNREYRTNIETINTVLDIKSKLVAGSYPIELTRQQSFADSGAADTTYDNETFIICLERAAYDFIVEQNKILNPINIFDPATVLNYRISPLHNLMRWFKSIINTYANITGTASRLFFSAGTGNFLASGNLDDATFCKLENNLNIDENGNLGAGNFARTADYTPLVENETATFEYPLSIAQYNGLKINPYGYIAYTCGNDTNVKKGFIKEIKFRPARGMANFSLRKKWQS